MWLYGLVHGCGTLWVPATGLGSVSAVAVRPHLTKNPCLTVGKGGTDCLFVLTTNCLSAPLMFLHRVKKETGKGRPARGKREEDR